MARVAGRSNSFTMTVTGPRTIRIDDANDLAFWMVVTLDGADIMKLMTLVPELKSRENQAAFDCTAIEERVMVGPDLSLQTSIVPAVQPLEGYEKLGSFDYTAREVQAVPMPKPIQPSGALEFRDQQIAEVENQEQGDPTDGRPEESD